MDLNLPPDEQVISNVSDALDFDLNVRVEDIEEDIVHEDCYGLFVEDEGLRSWIPVCDNAKKLFIGQFFATVDCGFEFYREYGRVCGFDIRRSTTKRFKDGSVYIKYFVCSSAGCYKSMSSTDKVDSSAHSSKQKRDRTSSFRTCCDAKLAIRFFGSKGFIVSKFDEEHNHKLASDSGKKFLRSNRVMGMPYRKFVFDVAKINIGGIKAHSIYRAMCGSSDNVGPTGVDFKNFARDLKNYIGKHDADMILENFKDKHETSDKSFRYEYKTDDAGHLSQIFWADGLGRRNFDVYGDVMSVDATYRTNKYNMIFVPFIGIDNHWKSTTFAAALLSKEDKENFEWVFDAFLKVMGKSPNCIVTDQYLAMKVVIPMKFPRAAHRLCMWHIMKKFPAKIWTVFCAESQFMKKLGVFVWSDHATPEEFENGWNSVVKEFGLEGNQWLAELFEMHRHWIPAYFIDEPMKGLLRTTSHSESSNFYFNHFVQKGDTLCEFYFCYESAIDRQLHINARLNHEDSGKPYITTPMRIERDASQLYTHTLFYKVRDEIKAGYFC